MDIFILVAMAAAAGFCAKFADEITERAVPLSEAVAAALLWGLLLGMLASSDELSAIIFAMALGTAFAGKIDHNLHIAGFAAFVAVIVLLPVRMFDPWLFSGFLVLAIIDEIRLPFRFLRLLGDRRLWLPLGALLVWIWTGAWAYFAFIAGFDVAYYFGSLAATRLFPPQAAAKAAKRKARKK